jgi:2-keto-myo-inositol isomerase
MRTRPTRREVIAGMGAALAAGAIHAAGASEADRSRTANLPNAESKPVKHNFIYCLNTSTIKGQKLTLVEEIDIAAKAGYHAMEPWISEIDEHVKRGGSLKELGQRFKDRGLSVESAIGFFEWIVDDDVRRAKALEEAKRNYDLCAQIGAKRIAAPPLGATDRSDIDLHKAAERYRALLDLGDQFGVVPQVEVWGFSKTLGRLGEAALVAIESGHPKACVLADVYHLYKGGSPFEGLNLLSASSMHDFHLNDYPADPPRDRIGDEHRVYPGDGIAPLGELFRDLRNMGYNGALSIELFNHAYWQQDALTVAKTALDKLKAVVEKSLA